MRIASLPVTNGLPTHPSRSLLVGPRGISGAEWAKADFLQRLICELEKKGALPDEGLPDTPEAAALIVRVSARVQQILIKRASSKGFDYQLVHASPTVPALNAAALRYRACGNHPVALVPEEVWQRSVSAYDEHVLAVTMTLGVELPHARARRDQDSLKLAVEFYACFKDVFGLKPAQLYREYRTFVSNENNRPGNPNKLPLKTFERRVVEQLVAWFPGLVEIASNHRTARNA